MLANKIMGATSAAPDLNYIEDVFSTYLYTGNGATQTINNGIDLAGKGGLVWAKSRTSAFSNVLTDTARGAYYGLTSNTTNEQYLNGTDVTAFNSNGFSLGYIVGDINVSGSQNASWTFRKQPKFFDVVTFTTGASGDYTFNHNLGSVPGCVFIKATSTSSNWNVYHRSIGVNSRLFLEQTSPKNDYAGLWGTPTSTTFTGNIGTTLEPNQTHVAYLFAHDAGGFGLSGNENVVSCGSFTTDGSGNATVNLGYEPQWIMYRRSASTDNWRIVDSMRGLNYSNYVRLSANLADVEADIAGDYIHPTATGFVTTGAIGASTDVIYIAIRRGPMKVPTDGTKVFTPIARNGTGAAATVTGVGFAPDFVISPARSNGYGTGIYDRLRGAKKALLSNSTQAEFDDISGLLSFGVDGVSLGSDTAQGYVNASGVIYINHFFRRAPSFFDEVCYTGTDFGTMTHTHNLGVTPQLIIVKNRSAAVAWAVQHESFTGGDGYLVLNTTAAKSTAASWFSYAEQNTNTTFKTRFNLNTLGQKHVAYLFATCAGVSKVGSYTGTGTTQAIACGFTAGARFVMIKRTDDVGEWYVWNSAQGIVAGNDPYMRFNTSAAEVTGTDYIDPSSAGFEISSTAPAAINASGGSYIFLAVA